MKWIKLNEKYENMVREAKAKFYDNFIDQLKDVNQGQWYSQLKRLSNYEQNKTSEVVVDEISHLSNKDQVEAIADHMASVRQEFTEIDESDIQYAYRYVPEQIAYLLIRQRLCFLFLYT